jgi:hypothetical protein
MKAAQLKIGLKSHLPCHVQRLFVPPYHACASAGQRRLPKSRRSRHLTLTPLLCCTCVCVCVCVQVRSHGVSTGVFFRVVAPCRIHLPSSQPFQFQDGFPHRNLTSLLRPSLSTPVLCSLPEGSDSMPSGFTPSIGTAHRSTAMSVTESTPGSDS